MATLETPETTVKAAAAVGRGMSRGARVKALRYGLEKRKRRLANSMAFTPEPRRGDAARWAAMQAEIETFEKTLADVLAGGDPPLAERTGRMTRELPDEV